LNLKGCTKCVRVLCTQSHSLMLLTLANELLAAAAQ